jgi:hypothetical protein
MGRPQSPETRKKIGESVKKTRQNKAEVQSPTAKMRQHLSDNFALGHPDGLAPARVRNFGGLGKEVTKIVPVARLQRELEEKAQKEQLQLQRIQQLVPASPKTESPHLASKTESRRGT